MVFIGAGFKSIGDILGTSAESLEKIEGIGKKRAEKIVHAAREYGKR
jgi:ERCC4-type nuclease